MTGESGKVVGDIETFRIYVDLAVIAWLQDGLGGFEACIVFIESTAHVNFDGYFGEKHYIITYWH